ncbi:Prolyl-tRNA synthetase associated domain-containing protein 1 [Glycine max]|nr:Prolyl-tRNA synthetase associated domain-containing protein 1 [Glycine max]
MGFSKEQLLARLKELLINFSQYEHPAILTVEEGEKYVGHLGGGVSKNLFLKDKKQRFYLVSALKDTKVDIKVLSQRLGLGKGGLRMVPSEALGEILQVSLGCVTPFAVVNESARCWADPTQSYPIIYFEKCSSHEQKQNSNEPAPTPSSHHYQQRRLAAARPCEAATSTHMTSRSSDQHPHPAASQRPAAPRTAVTNGSTTHGSTTAKTNIVDDAQDVSLLLDQGFKTQEFCFFHPLSNDMTISINSNDLDKFLKSIGRDPSYVDFEANPPVGKDQPPDLAALVPSGTINLPDQPEKQPSSQPTEGNHVSVDEPKIISAKVVKSCVSGKNTKEKAVNKAHSSGNFADVELFVEEILHKTSRLLLSEIKEDTITQHGENLGTVVSDNLRKGLSSDLENLTMIFKNTAYTEGFHAGSRHQPRRF